ncbi:hypothetical protein C8Q80DRAFT_1349908 [Daedaleopsis nitida]|nr:hypothetical protein C8Q80DRAFT_1349908 [Daedaleopsis nitida]
MRALRTATLTLALGSCSRSSPLLSFPLLCPPLPSSPLLRLSSVPHYLQLAPERARNLARLDRFSLLAPRFSVPATGRRRAAAAALPLHDTICSSRGGCRTLLPCLAMPHIGSFHEPPVPRACARACVCVVASSLPPPTAISNSNIHPPTHPSTWDRAGGVTCVRYRPPAASSSFKLHAHVSAIDMDSILDASTAYRTHLSPSATCHMRYATFATRDYCRRGRAHGHTLTHARARLYRYARPPPAPSPSAIVSRPQRSAPGLLSSTDDVRYGTVPDSDSDSDSTPTLSSSPLLLSSSQLSMSSLNSTRPAHPRTCTSASLTLTVRTRSARFLDDRAAAPTPTPTRYPRRETRDAPSEAGAGTLAKSHLELRLSPRPEARTTRMCMTARSPAVDSIPSRTVRVSTMSDVSSLVLRAQYSTGSIFPAGTGRTSLRLPSLDLRPLAAGTFCARPAHPSPLVSSRFLAPNANANANAIRVSLCTMYSKRAS